MISLGRLEQASVKMIYDIVGSPYGKDGDCAKTLRHSIYTTIIPQRTVGSVNIP